MNPSPEWYRPPAQILADLGIQEPADIDIEAIAEDCAATIRYQPLSGCAARIMGYKDRAIITIDKDCFAIGRGSDSRVGMSWAIG